MAPPSCVADRSQYMGGRGGNRRKYIGGRGDGCSGGAEQALVVDTFIKWNFLN